MSGDLFSNAVEHGLTEIHITFDADKGKFLVPSCYGRIQGGILLVKDRMKVCTYKEKEFLKKFERYLISGKKFDPVHPEKEENETTE